MGTTLILNDDRSVTIPTADGDITLIEPTLDVMAEVWQVVVDSDAEVQARLDVRQAEMNEHDEPFDARLERKAICTGPTSPYALGLCSVIKAVGGVDVAPGRLYSWAGRSDAIRMVFDHWSDPLPGQASRAIELLTAIERQLAMSQPTIPAT